jgi:hypothetical protein
MSDRVCKAYQDLECGVAELRTMCILCQTMVDDVLTPVPREANGYYKLLLTKEQFDGLNFAIMHLGEMIVEFYDCYYEKLEAPAPADAAGGIDV